MRLPKRQGRNVVRGHPLKKDQTSFARDGKAPHMADIEASGGGPNSLVLVDHAVILYGHLPSSEIDELRSTHTMLFDQRSVFHDVETVERSDAEEFHFKNESGIRWNHAAGAAGSISEIGRDDQFTLPSDLHAFHAFIPSLDDPPRAKRKRKWLTPINGAIELLPVFQPFGVMHRDSLAGLRARTGANLEVNVLQPRRRRDLFALRSCVFRWHEYSL